jgi:hypothetical protein
MGECYLGPMKRGSDVVCWHAVLKFMRWNPPPPRNERYGKTTITLNQISIASWNQPWVVAELLLAQRMRDAGWEAGWVDAYGQAPRDWADWIVTLRSLPSPLREQYEAITAAANEACRKTSKTDGNNKAHYRGRPDIIAWRGKAPSVTDAVFIEYKGPRDTVKPEQIEWFRAAIKESGSHDRFVIANWQN